MHRLATPLLIGATLLAAAPAAARGMRGGRGDDARKREHATPAPQAAPRPAPRNRREQSPPRGAPLRRERIPARGAATTPRAERVAPDRRERDRAQLWQRDRGWRGNGGWAGGPTWQANRAHHWNDEHLDWRRRGGYAGYRIPDARYRPWFGPAHYFRLRARPRIVGGHPRFTYGGYYFLIVDPWPEFWDDDWYYDDELYIAWDDGYYLYNRRHPGVAVAITVVL